MRRHTTVLRHSICFQRDYTRIFIFFFFQAEDGIRDSSVTGVQTCALPILKSNGGTLVIDDFGRQRVAPEDLRNRWIVPLERRVDYLALHTGKKIEVPFEQLVVFSTNLDEKDLADQAFLRRMGYRARVEPPTPTAYSEIFKRQAYNRGIKVEQAMLDHVLSKYRIERRQIKGCEPRDLLDPATDICLFE